MSSESRHYSGTGQYGGSITAPGNRTNVIAVKKLLEFARPRLVCLKLAEKTRVPKNKAETVRWRRPVNGDISTTTLTEGVTPDSQALVYEDVSVTLQEYGLVYEATSRATELGEDDIIADTKEVVARQMMNIKERVAWLELQNATNIIYANGSAVNAVNTVFDAGNVQEVVRTLNANVAEYYTEIDRGGLNENTTPIEASYVALCHTDLEPTLRGFTDFVTVDKYGGRSMIMEEEFGSYQNVRFITSPYLVPLLGAGASGGSSVKETGSNADVYPVILMGKHAFGCADLIGSESKKGYGGVKINVLQGATKDDPLNQRSYIAARWWDAPKILNQSWMGMIYTAAPSSL